MDRIQHPGARRAALTARIVAAYVAGQTLPASALPEVIRKVGRALACDPQAAATAAMPIPAVPIEASVRDGFLICLEDGRRFRSLKRHLRTVYDLTPAAYRTRWGLPDDYPMVAPAYSANRSALAKAIGLGSAAQRSGVVLWQAGGQVQVA